MLRCLTLVVLGSNVSLDGVTSVVGCEFRTNEFQRTSLHAAFACKTFLKFVFLSGS